MKKIIAIFLVTISFLFIPNVKATGNEKVNVYLFWGSYCPHCHNFIKYMIDNEDLYKDYGKIITYQVDGYENNLELMDEVSKNFDDVNGYIPLIIIGDKFHKEGFGEDGSDIIKAIKDAYEDSNYKDIVKEVIDTSNNKGTSKSLTEASKVIGYKIDDDTNEENNSGNVNEEVKKEENNRESVAEIMGYNKKSLEITPEFVLAISVGAIILAAGIVLVVRNSQKKKENK